MAFATAAQATRSPRNLGKITPSLTASMRWPPRPMRCSPLATDGGASICTTRSMAPMSMPSSSDEVATSARRPPLFRRSSISTRCARAIEPWCDRTSVSPASSLSAPASRSARRRLLTKISVDWCARISSSSRGWIADQMDGRVVADRRGPARDVVRRREPRHVLDRHLDGQLQRFLRAGVDDRHRPVPDGPCRAELAVDVLARRGRPLCLGRPPAAARRLSTCRLLTRFLRETSPLPRAAAASPTGRSAAAAARSAPRAARSTAPGARRAWSGRARGSRR